MHRLSTVLKKAFFIQLTFALISFGSIAQVNIAAANIDKITIRNWHGNMNGKSYTDYEIKLENNKWVSTQTEQYSNTLDSKFDSAINSYEHKFVTVINRLYIDGLVFAINHPVKSLQPQTLGITSKYLIDKLDSLYKKPYAFGPGQKALFKKHITQQNIYKGILQSATTEWMDVAARCTIKIISKASDTTSVESVMYSDFMFPWSVNKKGPVYNIAISRFCTAAINDKDPNRYLLDGESAYQEIYDYIYKTYIGKSTMK
jgi:hypothetical protein